MTCTCLPPIYRRALCPGCPIEISREQVGVFRMTCQDLLLIQTQSTQMVHKPRSRLPKVRLCYALDAAESISRICQPGGPEHP